jgi:hypothetical protein
MIRFLRQNTEVITTVCVALSVLFGGALLYIKRGPEAFHSAPARVARVIPLSAASSAAPLVAATPSGAALVGPGGPSGNAGVPLSENPSTAATDGSVSPTYNGDQ